MPPKGTKSAPTEPPKRAAQLSPPSDQDATQARDVVGAIRQQLQSDRPFRFFGSEAEFLRFAAKYLAFQLHLGQPQTLSYWYPDVGCAGCRRLQPQGLEARLLVPPFSAPPGRCGSAS